ncbi:hypothetical protein DL96DRAFT_1706174 [Flagelloscypha sp. PMI_526]|nr:hypothetical protein DL96DRAFT_1706174 [Flagelloscypha sp. PMI_526]
MLAARSPVNVPAEIWLEIANYLSQPEVRRLCALCRPFRELWIEWQRERIFLPTGTSYFVGAFDLSGRDWRTVAYDIWKALHARIESGDAAHTKSIVFYSPSYPEPTRRPSFMDDIVRSVGSRVKFSLFTSNLPAAYKKYISVESLAFLHEPPLLPSGPICYRYLAVPSIWSNFSANLRELAISISYADSLTHLLPSQTTPLPKLEVMRVGYLYRIWDSYWQNIGPPEPMLTRLAQLYTNQTLQVLDLKIVYPRRMVYGGGPPLVESLLPKDHIFPQLRRFWIVTERLFSSSIDVRQTSRVISFIHTHANTLRSVKPPSFSIASNDLTLWHSVASTTAKMALVELEILHDSTVPSQDTFRNLRRLSIHTAQLRLETFDRYAKELPQLLSLRVKYQNHLCTEDYLSRRTTNSLNSILTQWKLKDLALYPAHGVVPIPPDYSLMREIARLIPSVESFVGRGIKIEKPEDWEAKWPWTRNVYIDALMDGTPGSYPFV